MLFLLLQTVEIMDHCRSSLGVVKICPIPKLYCITIVPGTWESSESLIGRQDHETWELGATEETMLGVYPWTTQVLSCMQRLSLGLPTGDIQAGYCRLISKDRIMSIQRGAGQSTEVEAVRSLENGFRVAKLLVWATASRPSSIAEPLKQNLINLRILGDARRR